MSRFRQSLLLLSTFLLTTPTLPAQDVPADPAKLEIDIRRSQWGPELQLHAQQRDDFAKNLAAQAASLWRQGSPQQQLLAKRCLALALQLNPQNQAAMALSFRLRKGDSAPELPADYSPSVLAGLLFESAQKLLKLKNPNASRLAGAFLDLAHHWAPQNDEVSYYWKLYQYDHGPVEWSSFETSGNVAPTPVPQP